MLQIDLFLEFYRLLRLDGTVSIFSLHYYTPLCFTPPINKYLSKYLMKKVFGQTNDIPIVNGRKSQKKLSSTLQYF